MANKGRTTMYTGSFKSIKARNKAIAKAGGGKPGKRIKVTTTIKPKKKGK
jgi:hypothetical protein